MAGLLFALILHRKRRWALAAAAASTTAAVIAGHIAWRIQNAID